MLKGYHRSEEFKKNVSERMKKRIISDETKKKISESKKGIPCAEETKIKLAIANENLQPSEEAKRKMSIKATGTNNSQSKLSIEDSMKILKLAKNKAYKDIAEHYNISIGTVSNIVNGRHWTTRGDKNGHYAKYNTAG